MIRLPKLPKGLRWFTVNRQRVFPVYGTSGGLMARRTAIIIHHLAPGFSGDLGTADYHDGEDGKWFRLDFAEGATQAAINFRVRNAVNLLTNC